MESLKRVFLCFVLCISQSCFNVHGFGKEEIAKLKADLFDNYDASVLPLVQQSDTFQVQFQLGLSAIVKLDMDNAMMASTGNILARWQDRSLTWDPAQYANLKKLQVDIEKIWNPKIAQLDMVGEFASSTFAFVEHTGIVTMVSNSELRSFCEIDISYYPRDTHVCAVVLFLAYCPSFEVSIVPLTDSVNLANFKKHGVWSLTDTSVHTDTILIADVNGTQVEINIIVNTIKVRRRAAFSFIHKGIPLLLIAFITFFCHIVPLNSGDRISFSAAVFLALVFWIALIANDLPQLSSNVSLLSIIMIIPLCQSSVSVVTSVVLCRLSGLDNSTPIPNWLRSFVTYVKCPRCKWACRPAQCENYKQEPSIELKGSLGGLNEESHDEAGGVFSAKSESASRTSVHNSIKLESNVGSNDNSNTKTGNKPSTENEADIYEISWLVVANTLDQFVGVCSSIIVLVNIIIFIVNYS